MLDSKPSTRLDKAVFKLPGMNVSTRIKEAIETSGVKVATIAQRCGITPQAVYQWMDGSTEKLSGENLIELAELTGYDARWISKGTLPKKRLYPKTAPQARVLEIMQNLPEGQEALVLRLIDSIAEPPAKAG